MKNDIFLPHLESLEVFSCRCCKKSYNERIMKLHLPASLRRFVIAAVLASCGITCADAATLHPDVSIQTYTDFAQNKGRYAVGNTNALLQHLTAGGVTLTYTGGQAAITLPHEMIDFGGVAPNGASALVGYNVIASVNHVATQDPSFSANELGSSNSIRYYGIGSSSSSVFRHKPSNDYSIARLDKLVTDASCTPIYGSTNKDYSGITEGELAGELIYRVGGGWMYSSNEETGAAELLAYPYTYTTAGINTISSVGNYNAADGAFSVFTYYNYTESGVSEATPLPFQGRSGDSGSPSWVWNESTQQYEYLAALQSGNDVTMTQFRGDSEWSVKTMESFDVTVDLAAGGETIHLTAISQAGASYSDSWTEKNAYGQNVSRQDSTTVYSGAVTDAEGKELARYNGVQNGLNMWDDLSSIRDNDNWYNYDNTYINANLSDADFFFNNNLVLKAGGGGTQTVQLDATVDLGIGYVQFSRAEGVDSAEFNVQSGGAGAFQLNSAGMVVHEGVSVHMQLSNPTSYMREWRKIGAGDLYIEGSGNNGIFLNLGGSGRTFLDRDGGYAAYNVLVNNGATVVISGTGQIERDLTFGNGGGVLDMNGVESMVWNNSNAASDAGFTIHALDEQAVITNSSGASTLTWTQNGTQTWLGSFRDTEAGALSFMYKGGGKLTMHSIHTDLTHHEASGVQVQSGTLALAGTNTVHAVGSLTGTNAQRYSHADDWHYADASMDVSVAGGATFELGSHARLTGDVTVASGGTYIMREGVRHRMEYIEGGYVQEDTDGIRDFFGHKGNVSLASGATMQVAFSEGTDSTLLYEGNISGEGSVTVAAQQGVLKLSGDNTFSGTKTVTQGGLWASSNAALGDTGKNKWVIAEQGWLASDGFTQAEDILTHIDGSSTGVLALSRDVEGQIDLSGHTGLIIGAAEGCTVRYGTADAELSSIGGQWVLGGGGGNLEVLFKLSGKNNLVLGNAYGKGNVHLSNVDNDFSGDILFTGGVTLTYDDGALGNAGINISYGNRALLAPADIGKVKTASAGAVLVDRMPTADLDLSKHSYLSIGASEDVSYAGRINVAEGMAYRFGGGDGRLTVESALESGRSMVIDGQGFTGGSVVFTNAQDFDGHITVMGYDPSRLSTTAGKATLSFVADHALAGATGFAVRQGGVIDLAGTDQTLAGLVLESGGSICDSSEARSSTLTLTGNGTLGSGNIDVAHVVKAGSGTLTLNNATTFSDFAVTGGTLKLGLAAKGAFRVEGGGVLDLSSSYSVSGSVTLGAGGSLKNVSNLSSPLTVVGDSTLSGSGITLNGAVSVNEGATLSVQPGSAALLFSKDSSLQGAGALSITTSGSNSSGGVSFYGDNSAFSGRLAVTGGGSSSVYFNSATSFGSGTVSLNKLAFSVGDSNTASSAVASTLEVGAGGATFNGASGTYYFSDLAGSGTLRSAQYSGGSMCFGGSLNAFSGTLDNASSALQGDTLRFGFGGAGSNYHSITGSAAETADLFGEGVRLRASDAKASVTYEFQYADRVALNATVEDTAHVTQSGAGTLVLRSQNSSTGTLTIAHGAVELAEGSIWVGSLAGNGTLINKSTEAVTLASASGFAGSLELMQGSSLTLGASARESFSLEAGQTLSVLAPTEGDAGSATLIVSSLVLNGGTLAFSGETLKPGGGGLLTLYDGSKYLNVVNGASGGTHTSISFFDASGLALSTDGDEYALLQGNLAGIAGNTFSATGLDECFTASFSVGANNRILFMTLSAVDGYGVWAGTAAQDSWDSGFGGSAPGASDTAWFNDTAADKTVSISGKQEVAGLVFNATEDYTLAVEKGASLSVGGTLELRNHGKVTLGSGVSVAGNVSLAAGSELVVQDFSTLSGKIDGQGATLTVDAGSAEGSLQIERLGTLNLASGTYEFASTSDAASVETIRADGGQLYLSTYGSYGNQLVLGGNGSDAALRMAGHANTSQATYRTNLNGAVSLVSDSAVEVVQGLALLNSSLTGNGHTLTKKGDGTLWLATASLGGFCAEEVSFVVEGGELRLGGTVNKGIPEGINSIELKSSAMLGFCALTSELTAALALEGGSTLHLSNGAGANAEMSYTFSGDVALSASESAGQWVTINTAKSRGLTLSGQISGDGGFSVAGGSTTLSLTLEHAANVFTGGIKVTGSAVTLNLANAGAAGSGGIQLGSAQLNVAGNEDGSYGTMDNAISGSGSVVVTGGMLEMAGSNSYTGRTTVKEGATLKLTSANSGSSSYVLENGAALVLSGDGALTVNKAVTFSAKTAAASSRAARGLVDGVLESVTVTEDAMSGTEESRLGSVYNASVVIAAQQYTLTNLELESSAVLMTTVGGQLSLNDLFVDPLTTFSGAEGVTMALQNVIYTVDLSAMSSGGSYGQGNSSVLAYSLSNFSRAALTGNVQLQASSQLAPQGADYIAIDFGTGVDVSALSATLSFDGGRSTIASSHGTQDSVLLFALSSDAVPEPASATLALLGLSALTLRRRRR